MFGFLGFGKGNYSVDWECPECGRKIPVAAATDTSRWGKCVMCEDLESLERQMARGFDDSSFNETPEDRIIEMVEDRYGSGKAMQVADILRGE